MKNEIKEIKISKSNHSIVIIKNGITVKEQFAIDDEILDYITNLQEENDYLKDIVSNTELSDEIKKADKWSKRELYKINYQRLQVNRRLIEERDKNLDNVMFLSKVADEKQERIDKAIEYIERAKYVTETMEGEEFCKNYEYSMEDLLNILQGEDKDE